ncbi:MAG: cupin domain-containing protein [Sphingomonas sp.]
MPKIDLDSLEPTNRTGYPPPFNEPVKGRWQRKVGDAAGLTELGARHVTLDPGAWSSQRHWHVGEDELLIMLSGRAVLVEDEGESELEPGDIVAWAKGVPNGHNLINRSDEPCTFVCVSAGADAGGDYPDIDMMWKDSGFVHKDGTPYGDAKRLSFKS